MDDRRIILNGFCKEINSSEKTAELYKEGGVFSASIKSLKGLRNIGDTNTGRFFKDIFGAGKEKGFRGAIDEASKYKQPEVNLGKNIDDKIDIPEKQNMEATLGRGVRHAVGNTADNVKNMTKNIGAGQGSILNQGFQLGKNLKDTTVKQLRGSQFVEKEFDNLDEAKDIITKGDDRYLKSKWLPDRKIQQETGRGALVKKRFPMRAVAPFTTSPGAAGAAGSSYMAQSALEPDKSMSERLTTSLKDGGKFLAGDAVGFASTIF